MEGEDERVRVKDTISTTGGESAGAVETHWYRARARACATAIVMKTYGREADKAPV